MARQIDADFPAKLEVLFKPCRYKVLHGGRGSGKSWGVARALLVTAASKPTRVLCAREIQKSIADSVHKLLTDQIAALGLQSFFEVGRDFIRGKNGSEFAFVGIRTQNIGNLKSVEGVDICWVEEGQVVSKKSWETLIPTIRKPSSEIWVTFNPELRTDETYQRFVVKPPTDATVVKVNWSDNPWFPEVLNKERLEMKERDPIGYDTIWEGECRQAVDGAIYHGEVVQLERQGRIRPVPYDSAFKVHTVWDLGWNDSMSIILAQKGPGGEMRVIGYIEDSHRTLQDYAAELNGKRFNWGKDYLPHDGAHRDFKTGKSAEQILREHGRNPFILGRGDVEAGIKQARAFMAKCYFDEIEASGLVECLRHYRRAINTNTQEPGAPVHDQYSHGADAFRYLSQSADLMTNESGWSKALKYLRLGYA